MSESIRPTRRPRRSRARARLAATVDLPTPPLPDATAILKRTFGRIWDDAAGGGAPGGAAGEGGFTSSRIVTAETPGRAWSRSVASRWISSAAFGDSVVISRRNDT